MPSVATASEKKSVPTYLGTQGARRLMSLQTPGGRQCSSHANPTPWPSPHQWTIRFAADLPKRVPLFKLVLMIDLHNNPLFKLHNYLLQEVFYNTQIG